MALFFPWVKVTVSLKISDLACTMITSLLMRTTTDDAHHVHCNKQINFELIFRLDAPAVFMHAAQPALVTTKSMFTPQYNNEGLSHL